jgi:hypothetical protein
MSRMTATTRIRAPIELAWAFVSDPARTLAVGGDVEIRLVSGSFTEPGSRFVASRRSGGQWIDAVHEVVRVDPPTYLETRIVMRDIVAVSSVRLEATGPRTCTVHGDIAVDFGGGLSNLVPRLLNGLLAPFVAKRVQRRLVRVIEAEAAQLGE